MLIVSSWCNELAHWSRRCCCAGVARPDRGLLGDETMIGLAMFAAFVVGVATGAVGVLLYIEGV